jgi:hypothetical protein
LEFARRHAEAAAAALAEYAQTRATRGVRAWADSWWDLIEGELPSVRYVYESLTSRLGAEVVTIPSPGGDGLAADEGRILEAIEERTALVAEEIDEILESGAWRRWREAERLAT